MQLNIKGALIKSLCNEVGREKVRVIKPKQDTHTHTHTHTRCSIDVILFIKSVYRGRRSKTLFLNAKFICTYLLGGL